MHSQKQYLVSEKKYFDFIELTKKYFLLFTQQKKKNFYIQVFTATSIISLYYTYMYNLGYLDYADYMLVVW